MFELRNHSVKITSVQNNPENHGDKVVPTQHLSIEAACDNGVLIYFHPELRQTLFKRNDSPDLIDQADPDALSVLKLPKLALPLKWEWEGIGYALRIGYGIGGLSDIVLTDCKVDKFHFTPQEGGTVIIAFRVIAHSDLDDEIGKLFKMAKLTVEVDVIPPEPTTVQELFGEQQAA